MIVLKKNNVLISLLAIVFLTVALPQTVLAGVIDTGYVIAEQSKAQSIDRIQSMLARENVAGELQRLGVAEADIVSRLQGLTAAELVALENRIADQTAGSGVVGVIGTVFIVLLILELVGVTDIFTQI